MAHKDRKQQIREELLEKRKGISKMLYREYSSHICHQITTLDEFKKAKTVHCYVSMNKRHEVNTHPLVKELLTGPKKVAVPVMKEGGRLEHIQLESFNDLKSNEWQVLEPVSGKEISPDQLDIVLVPMVGGDLHKNRMGYGGGYYDRFLQNTSCPAVGLLFEKCLVDKLPTESFDVPLTKVVTEQRIIS